MHNLTKIKLFRLLLRCTYPFALIFVYPFALMKKKNHSPFFFFFDRYSIGGAQKIHLDVLTSIADIHKQLYFTRLSVDKSLKDAFYATPKADIQDIHRWCDYLFFRLFSVHFYAFYVNRHKEAHVFSSNSTFFYDMLPFFNKHVIKTELLHNFTHGKNGMEFFGLANVQYLNNRIVYDNFTLANIMKQYEEHGVDPKYQERIKFIEPGVTIPPSPDKCFEKLCSLTDLVAGGLVDFVGDYHNANIVPKDREVAKPIPHNKLKVNPITNWLSKKEEESMLKKITIKIIEKENNVLSIEAFRFPEFI